MGRRIAVHGNLEEQKLRVTEERKQELASWLFDEIEDAFSSRFGMETTWTELLRQYEGIPKNPVKNYPIENAPNIEVTLGAIAADSIFAQAMDLKWSQTSPLLTARPVGNTQEDQDDAKALQRFVNWVTSNECDARGADEIATLDCVQLGTGIFYVPWTQTVKKTRVAVITSSGPLIHAVPPEDFLVPGGVNSDLEMVPWAAIRFWLTEGDLADRAKANDWNTEGAEPCPSQGWVRTRRELLGRSAAGIRRRVGLYDIFDVYCYYDIDDCGTREDLLVTYNHTGKRVLKVQYNPFDHRPMAAMTYQTRPHLFWGLGVMEMMSPYQAEATDIHNERNANMMLANTRHWVGREGAIPGNMKIRINKVTLVPDPDRDLKALVMADVYPSSTIAEQMTMMLAERRVGVNEMSMPRPSSIMGSRTPGITALTMMQQVNRRFTPAFDAMRNALAGAAKQCLYRYQERLLAGDADVEGSIMQRMGMEDGARIIRVLRDFEFDEAYRMELTASSASVNREADRQNAIMLVNVLSQYYERALNLVMLASNPQTPPAVQKVAVQIAEKAGEIIARTVTTFDQMRDPQTFIVDFGNEMDSLQGLSPEGLAGLSGMMGQLGAGGAGMPPGVGGGMDMGMGPPMGPEEEGMM